MSLLSLPEELIQKILANLIPPPSLGPILSTDLAPVYVSRQMNRIATALLYQSIYIPSSRSATLLSQTLLQRPDLPAHVTSIVAVGLWDPVFDILSLCTGIHALDLTVSREPFHLTGRNSILFSKIVHMRHLTLRGRRITRLNELQSLVIAITHAVEYWPDLHTVDIDIILSEFSSRSLLLADISVLAATLACSSPALHTFATLLPFKWIDALRTIASSPSLQKIVLTDDSIIQTQLFPPASILNPGLHFRALRDIMLAYAAIPSLAPVMRAIADATDPAAPLEGREDAADAARAMVRGVSALDRARWRRCNPFLVEARRHTRLVELIAAGTPWYVPDMELTQAVPVRD